MLRRGIAIKKAKKFVEDFDDVLIKANLVGSLVRDAKKHFYVGDIDILIISKHNIYHGPPLNLFYTTEEQWEAAILYLSMGMSVIQWNWAAIHRKLKFTRHGLFTRKRIPQLVSTSAEEICEILGQPMPRWTYQVLYKGEGRLK
jgi:DNA polymerase/3'-5' exonuclease PolX